VTAPRLITFPKPGYGLDGVVSADGASAPTRPLQDVRVVEVGSYVSGPLAGLMLAELGATVIKVEPPSGDPMRSFGLRHHGLSALWVNVNHDKQSVAIDLKSVQGHSYMLELAAAADVLIMNWRPGVAENLGLGDEVLVAKNPQLIRMVISGFGETGPRAKEPVFDVLLQATTGLAAMEADDAHPTALRSLVADKTTAVFAAQSILAALYQRTRTGVGSRISLAMLDVMSYFDFPDLCQDRTFLDGTGRQLRRTRSALLPTEDGFVAISPVSGRQIGNTCTAVGHPEWIDDLKQIAEPTTLMNELYNRVETVTVTGPTSRWLELFARYDVPAAQVLSADEHFADPQVVHNDVYSTAQSPAGPVRRVRHPAIFDGQILGSRSPAPSLGEHTDLLLSPDEEPVEPLQATTGARSLDVG
jgi:crotonobetainyl-CoA:carnitine CoA-transferase CaiB-like acyl-CoA transferase